ncbi:MAG: RagB/SusD family nutrient uptake outer membrane protein [Proteiniphilum sp.]|uniref:RagB/SusD family nutrient uptake outer membrane protein n=1 Tax=Proteiniphilum sp. TaxID=1926877 RepID=UPI002B2173E5|nr:RagB/SusD family nutrient uptake outer membrane protein [Proteiniphilum sp.]MEA5129435.1 RagB/SusD family nutrient uptake outer membrane protein [Proteiniphilum sp.]
MKIRYIIIGILVGLFSVSCDILDKEDQMSLGDGQVWSSEMYATNYLNQLYRDNAPQWDLNISGKSDEAEKYGDNELYGQLILQNLNDYWYYDQIRRINLLLQKLGTSTLNQELKNKLRGQALVLRAWRYFQMVRLYGGIPMILEPQELTDDIYPARSKTSESIAIMVKDLDDAYELLPWEWTGSDEGRYTKAVALALKGRILLFHASPQFTPVSNNERWLTAYDANQAALTELRTRGFGLYPDYGQFWFDEMNEEVVMVTRYHATSESVGYGSPWNAATRPLDEAQNYTGANHPTWNLVKSYPMVTGEPIDESSLYDPVLFWKNRDPRFRASIVYNGSIWELSGKTARKQWTYIGAQGDYTSQTGFYCRKAVDISLTPAQSQYSSTDWVEIRFAEVMLNFAECAAELGKLDEAYAILKEIRQRAGIESGSNGMHGLKAGMSKDEMIDAIMLERKIELAFEGKRYWDLRRRRLFESELNGTFREGMRPSFVAGMNLDKLLEIQNTADFENDYSLYFKDSEHNTDRNYVIDYKENYYFFGLPNKHLETNSQLEQTAGWNNGTFDPLL